MQRSQDLAGHDEHGPVWIPALSDVDTDEPRPSPPPLGKLARPRPRASTPGRFDRAGFNAGFRSYGAASGGSSVGRTGGLGREP